MPKVKVLACGGAAKRAAAFLRENGYSVKCAPAFAESEAAGADAVLLLPPDSAAAAEEAAGLARRGVAVLCMGAEPPADCGAVYLPLPVSPAVLLQTLSLAVSINGRLRALEEENERLRALEEENERLKTALSDFKLIDRAKCALVQYLGMTEKDAHRFIEKQAMDRRMPRRDVAVDILKTYEP